MNYIFSLIILSLLTLPIRAEELIPERTWTVSGHVSDGNSGEEMIAANVYIKELGSGTVTNPYGFYSLTMEEGYYTLGYSFVGYQTVEIALNLTKDTVINIDLYEESKELEEVVITAERPNENVTSVEMGTAKLAIESIRRIPALMGEVDVIKAIQLLPGVQASSEGSSGFSVRGGSIDQNLILLDEATVYNASHLMGFFSVFNNDAIKDVKLYKGDIPASSGGRLSSLLDVRMKEGNNRQFSGTGGVGTISSRLTLEGPIVKDKTSYILSGRRTYADLFLPFAGNEDIRDNRLFFYDLNAKVNHIINDNNRLFLSGYFGEDVFENQFAGLSFGNRTLTLRWNHVINPKLFSNFTLINSKYNYQLGTPEDQPNAFRWDSDLTDYSLKADFTYYPNPVSTYKFGLISTYHIFNPGLAKGLGEETIFTEFQVPENFAFQHGIYVMGEDQVGQKWTFKYGLRLSMFQNMGEATVYNYNEEFLAVDSSIYDRGDIYNTYWGLEPRLGVNYLINDENSIKASYSRTRQYMQLAQNSTAGTPLDIWFPASPNVEPQISDQYSIGYFRNFLDNTIETSIEAYYKDMRNTIDFKDHANLLLNPQLEGEIRTGNSWSYGLEFLVRLNKPRLNGWVSYTLSKTERKIEGINNNDPYNAPYDKPHDIAIVLNYKLSDRILLGGNWVFSSGLPYTFPTGRFVVMGKVLPVYSNRNEYRFDNYHRMDLSFTLLPKQKAGRKWSGEWNLSVYNVYGRKNTWAINFVQDPKNPDVTYAEKTYLFSIIPAITYNFKF